LREIRSIEETLSKEISRNVHEDGDRSNQHKLVWTRPVSTDVRQHPNRHEGAIRCNPWDGTRSRVAIIMLNPSTADETQNDPTIRRCIAFAQSWGYESVEIVNLFAYRTSYPKELSKATEPIGIENDNYVLQASNRSSRLVFA
jgi:Protein of unknown function (DUF1643)